MIEVKKGLQQFKKAKVLKNECFNYVPTTMDELMDRFVLNMKRNDAIEKFDEEKKILYKDDIRNEEDDALTKGVVETLNAMNTLFDIPVMNVDERQPNTENKLYLKLLRLATRDETLTKTNSLDKLQVIKKKVSSKKLT